MILLSHSIFPLFSFLLYTFFSQHVARISTLVFDDLLHSFYVTAAAPSFFTFIHIIFVFRIIEFMLISCEHKNITESIRRRRRIRGKRDTKQWCSVNAFFISRHYRCVAISHIHICVHIYRQVNWECRPEEMENDYLYAIKLICMSFYTYSESCIIPILIFLMLLLFLDLILLEYCRLSSFITFIWHSRMMPAYRKYFHVFNISRKNLIIT